MTLTITGFGYERVTVASGVSLHTAIGGSGSADPPIVLLHGFPQTHLMWRHVAADLATEHTVIVADYRASAGIDIEHDQADRAAGRALAMPVTVVQQDWGAALGFDAVALWRPWAADLVHHTTDAGHFMAEEAPGQITALLRQLMTR